MAGETTSGGSGKLPGFKRLLARFRRPSGSDQRQHPRVYDRPLKLLIDGRRYKTLDWSMSGMRIAGYPAAAAVPNATVAGTILAGGQVKRGEFVAEVVRVLPDGSVGVRFVKLWSETFISMSAR